MPWRFFPTAADFNIAKAKTLEFFVTQLDVKKDKKVDVEAPRLVNPSEWFEFKVMMESYLMKIRGVNKVLLRYVIKGDSETANVRVAASDWDIFLWTGALPLGVQYKVDNASIFEILCTTIDDIALRGYSNRKRWSCVMMVQKFGSLWWRGSKAQDH